MIQPHDDKKKVHEPFKLRGLMLEFDEYLRVFIIPQIPREYADIRNDIRAAMNTAWREVFFSAATVKRQRRHHLTALRVELAMVETYLTEVRDICYRGKNKRTLDQNSMRRFDVCATRFRTVMDFVWKWIKNEESRVSSESEEAKAIQETEEI